jgi:hypothetical protein
MTAASARKCGGTAAAVLDRTFQKMNVRLGWTHRGVRLSCDLARGIKHHVPGQPGDLGCSEPCLDGEQSDAWLRQHMSGDILNGFLKEVCLGLPPLRLT